MNRHQKKLNKLIDKNDVDKIVNLLHEDTKGSLGGDRAISRIFVDYSLYTGEYKDLFKKLCNFAFENDHVEIFSMLESYKDFHFEDFLFILDHENTQEYFLKENIFNKQKVKMLIAVLKHFNISKGYSNHDLIDRVLTVCFLAMNHSNPLYKRLFNQVSVSIDIFEKIENYFLFKQLLTFLEDLSYDFFADPYFQSDIRQKIFMMIIKSENKSIEKIEMKIRSNRIQEAKEERSFLNIFYKNNSEFLLMNPMFIENLKLFKIILKSMSFQYNSETVLNTFLAIPFENHESILNYIKKEKPKEYMETINEILFNEKEDKSLKYKFSTDFSKLNIEKYTPDLEKECFHINIRNVGFINSKELSNQLIISIDSNKIIILRSDFKNLEGFYAFKDKIEKFIDNKFDDFENETLKIN